MCIIFSFQIMTTRNVSFSQNPQILPTTKVEIKYFPSLILKQFQIHSPLCPKIFSKDTENLDSSVYLVFLHKLKHHFRPLNHIFPPHYFQWLNLKKYLYKMYIYTLSLKMKIKLKIFFRNFPFISFHLLAAAPGLFVALG